VDGAAEFCVGFVRDSALDSFVYMAHSVGRSDPGRRSRRDVIVVSPAVPTAADNVR